MTDMSSLSLFHKILILVEDKGSITLKDLALFGNTRQGLGALGRLEGLQLIERTKDKDGDTFTLTEKGDTVLADLLDHLPNGDTKWDEKWRMIMFDIPESKRTLRQTFRLKLADLGARMLHSSVWITPSAAAVEKFKEHLTTMPAAESVHFFEATCLDAPIDVAKLWHLDDVKQEYSQLFKSFAKEYPKLKKKPDPAFEAKCMIVRLALVAKKDPQLPDELMPKAWIGKESEEWYRKLRAHCQ